MKIDAALLLCMLYATCVLCLSDNPEDPDFYANDGDLESEVNPEKAPEGNFNIVEMDGVSVLNRDTFAWFVKPKDIVMVEFYAPWCGHCKNLEPEYSKAAKELKKDGIHLAMVDATKEDLLAKEFMVQGFPTLLLFKKGEKIDQYSGERTADGIIEYMRRHNDPNWKPPPSAIVELGADNFNKFVKEKELTLLLFYAPWCKHCKQVMPELEGAAHELSKWGISVAKVDGTKEKDLADTYGIAGWPAFKMFRKGRLYEYKDGPREKDNIIAYMRSQFQSPSTEKTTIQAVTNGMDRLETTVVGFFEAGSDLYDEYIVSAYDLRGVFKCMHTFSNETAQHFKIPMNSVAVFIPEIFSSPYENSTYVLTKKSATSKEITQFVSRNSVPLVGQRTIKNKNKYWEKPLLVVYYDVNYDFQFVEDTQYIRKKVVEVAKKYSGSNLRFAISSESEFADEIKALGMEDTGEDVSLACYTEKQKFRMVLEEEFESGHLDIFIESLRKGSLKPYMKSMPVPKKQEEHVLRVVADTYDEEIHKQKKDVVVYFYAPWCGHCKELDPVYKKVAKKILANNENIIFAKYDGTSNDIPYMYPELKGFPALFFLSAYDKFDPILFQGDTSYKPIKDWVNRHSSIFLTEEEKLGKTASEDEEIESFTSENFEDDVTKERDEL